MTSVRFQAYADLRHSIVTGVIRRNPDIDLQSAHSAGLEGELDHEVLAISDKEERVLVTHDRKTMPTEYGKFISSQTSYGVIMISQRLSANEAIESIILVWEASTADEWINQIMSIPF